MVDFSTSAREFLGLFLLAGLRRLSPAHASCRASMRASRRPKCRACRGFPRTRTSSARCAHRRDSLLTARQLFDVERDDANTTLSRLANRLHVPPASPPSRTSCCSERRCVSRGLLEESARILRDTRYLRDALIRPVAYHDGVVDVEVTTQEVWTLNPGFSFGRKGGKNTGGIEVEDLNFLGSRYAVRRRASLEASIASRRPSTIATGNSAPRGGISRRVTPTTVTADWRSSG